MHKKGPIGKVCLLPVQGHTSYLEHLADMDRGFLLLAVEEGSGEVHALQGAVAMENCCHGDDAVGVQVGPGQSQSGEGAVHLEHGCHLDASLASNGITIQRYGLQRAIELGAYSRVN